MGTPSRPHTLDRIAYIGRSVSYTMPVFDRGRIFDSQVVVDAMIRKLREAAQMHECLVPIFCFMPDHAHLLAMPGHEKATTLDMIEKFKLTSGIWLYNHGLPRWQPGNWDEMVGSADDWRAVARYIAMNPVREGLVESYDQYPFLGSLHGRVSELFH